MYINEQDEQKQRELRQFELLVEESEQKKSMDIDNFLIDNNTTITADSNLNIKFDEVAIEPYNKARKYVLDEKTMLHKKTTMYSRELYFRIYCIWRSDKEYKYKSRRAKKQAKAEVKGIKKEEEDKTIPIDHTITLEDLTQPDKK